MSVAFMSRHVSTFDVHGAMHHNISVVKLFDICLLLYVQS